VAAVRFDGSHRVLSLMRWGLIPHWADDPKIGYRLINARADTVATKPSFRSAFKQRRCLIAADGFYEWQKRDGAKQPYLIRRADGEPFAFAGLWEHWHGADQEIESCTIITTDANDLMRPIHDRMPVILAPADYDRWLDPAVQKADLLQTLLRPLAEGALTAILVSTRVNNPKNDDAKCVEALAG
jgi:putative SOS response-associated peptidase YedK